MSEFPPPDAENEPEVKQWRDLVIETKALDLAWSKGITGRRIDFPQENGKLVWGIETEIPICFEEIKGIYIELVKKFAKERGEMVSDQQLEASLVDNVDKTWFKGIRRENSFFNSDLVKLPPNIKRIRLIELSPQETLSPPLRNIKSTRNFWSAEHPLVGLTKQHTDKLVSGSEGINQPTQSDIASNKQKTLEDLFYNVLTGDKTMVGKLIQELDKPGIDEILIVNSHGGYDNTIGEQSGPVKKTLATIGGETVDLSDIQAEGNWIDLNEVIERYDNGDIPNPVLVSTCYLGNDNLSDRGYRKLVFRARGKVGTQGGDPLDIFRKKTTTLVNRD